MDIQNEQANSPVLLSKVEAIDFLGLESKTFENYYKQAQEFAPEARANGRGRFKFDQGKLLEWKRDFEWRTVTLDKEDYSECLDFALAMHFRGYVTSDFGSGRQREFGQKITNWIKGQLGEVAVKKFFKTYFQKEIQLDFEIRDEIVPQDIVGIEENGIMRLPKIGLGIKSSKPKNAFLILGNNEIGRDQRISDAYIYCRPNLPDDHLLRITKDAVTALVQGQRHYEKYIKLIPDFSDISCEIAGWCWINELRQVAEIPGQTFDGIRFVRESGKLKKSREDWQFLINQL